MTKSKTQIIQTADGSPTVYLPELDETYHSRHGALQESNYVFIEHGLELLKDKDSVRVLEVGMGTGLNALLSWEWAERNECHVDYIALEPFPLSNAIAMALDFGDSKGRKVKLNQIHETDWGVRIELDEHFNFTKHQLKLLSIGKTQDFDLIYYDAFGPRAQPEMWDAEHIGQVCSLLAVKGTLVTYCSQGQFRRNLKSEGLEVSKLPGPPGKREMVRAVRR